MVPVSRIFTAALCVVLLICGNTALSLQSQSTSAPNKQGDAKLPAEQLDSLVAPIALYPDPLLAQVLAASTYPLEIVQLQQWLEKNKNLKDAALTEAVAKQNWDPSVQAMASLPDVVKKMAEMRFSECGRRRRVRETLNQANSRRLRPRLLNRKA
jgi:uncharacterized protein DUF3300